MILVWQEGGDDGYAAEMHARGFDHLALHAEHMDDGCPVATADAFLTWQCALAANDRHGEYYPDGIAEVIPLGDCGYLVCALIDRIWTWRSDGERNADGALLYRLTDMGDWTVHPENKESE